MKFALINAKIYDFETYLENGYVVFSDQILEVGDMKHFKKTEDYEIIDCDGNFVLPGFVSAHTHLYSTLARGMSVPFNPKNFMEILKQLWWKMDHFLDKRMIYYSALMGGLDQLKCGTTCLVDHHASFQVLGSLNEIHKALRDRLGVRGLYAFETSDRFDIEASIKENIDFIDTFHEHFASGLFGMHASLSLNDETLQKVSKSLKGNGIHIHVAESKMDEDECQKMYGKSVVERLDSFNLINDKSILVHCTHINDLEMDIIKSRNATIAVNVTSNLNNAVGLPDIRKMFDKGIKVMIGNDGLIQSMPIEYLNTYYTTHLKNQSVTQFGLGDIVKMINNGYDFVGDALNIKIGKMKKDYVSDLQIVKYENFTPLTKDNVFGHLFFGLFPNWKPQYVFVNGKMLINNYKIKEDVLPEYETAKKEAAKLWKTIAEEGKNLKYSN